MTGFVTGFLAPTRGLSLVMTNARMRRWALIPYVLTFLVFSIGIFLVLSPMMTVIPEIATGTLGIIGVSQADLAWPVLYWTIMIVAWPISFVAVFYLLYLVTRAVAAPVYSLLAERTLMELGALKEQPFALVPWLGASLRMLVVSIFRTLLLAIVAFFLFAMSFIPGVGFFTAFCFLLLAAFDILDFSLEALQMGLRARFRFFGNHFLTISGFACALGLVFLVPGLNFLIFPAAVVGGGDVVRRLLPPVR